MSMSGAMRRCQECGQEIAVITWWGLNKRMIVDAEAVMVTADADGEDYVRIDGSKVKGREVPIDSIEPAEPAYRMHRRSCPGRKP